jgi:hypothetical protein
MAKNVDSFEHACPICNEQIKSCFEELPTVCPNCRNVILECGVCNQHIRRTPIAYCRKCKRPLCLECRNGNDPVWQGLKWWSLCHGCGGNGAR